MTDIRKAFQSSELPKTIFIHQGDQGNMDSFFERYWPEAITIRDSRRKLYKSFGLARGSMWQIFGPRSVGCALKTGLKGHAIGQVVGDPFQMPGLFLIHDKKVVWTHEYQHAGDNPKFSQLSSTLSPHLQSLKHE
jgi:hypothetical protein